MKNNVLVGEEQALGTDQLLKLTALVYLKEALKAQEYETCQELIETAKNLNIDQSEINDVITDYLKTGDQGRQKTNRLRIYKEV